SVQIAACLALTEDAAAQLLERALQAFAAGVGVAPESAEDAYADWAWAEPPRELWESLYPAFYKALDRRLRTQAEDPAESQTVALPAVASSRWKFSRARRRARGARRRPRMGVIVGLLLPALLVAGALSYLQRPAHHKHPHG